MIWGVGTGRCGTRSLAALLKGRHEPGCWQSQPVEYHHTGAHRDWLVQRIAERLALGVPAAVDLQHSYVVPLIEQVDPEASFIWMVREPVACISSLLSGGSWTRGDGFGNRKLSPADGWPEDASRLDKGIWCWLNVNQLLVGVLADQPHELWLTSELPTSVHLNKYGKCWVPSEREIARIRDETQGLWCELGEYRLRAERPIFTAHVSVSR